MSYDVTNSQIESLFLRAKGLDELLAQDNSKKDHLKYQHYYNGLMMAISILDLNNQYDEYLENN